jgi:hypothetical protein
MIAIAITPAAYKALKATLPMTEGAASPGADGQVRIWLDCKFVERLAQMRAPGESYSDVILRRSKASPFASQREAVTALMPKASNSA